MATAAPALPVGRALDLAGAALVVLSVAWTFWTARRNGGDPLPVAALQVGCAVSYTAARAASGRYRAVVPLLVVAGAVVVLVLGPGLPSSAPLGPPLGYANANAALYVAVAVAAAMAGAGFRSGSGRTPRCSKWHPATALPASVVLVFAGAAVASGSATAVVVLCLALALWVSRVAGGGRAVPATVAVVVLLAVSLTALFGVALETGRRPPLVGLAERTLNERRLVLWREAAVITHRRPLDGVGPGRFQDESPVARADPDARWAHSGFLQQAAEAGAVGLALVLATFGWGFARIWSGTDDTLRFLGAVALGALGLHASVDYVLHFAAVPLVTAALVGVASATPPPGTATAPHPARAPGTPG